MSVLSVSRDIATEGSHQHEQFNGTVRIGVVASMKRGLEQFIFRELTHLERLGAEIELFPTKHGEGLYAPKDSWRVCTWSVLSILFAQPLALLRQPGRYLQCLFRAIQYRAVVELFFAAYFSDRMQKVDVIYSTFGDRKLFVGYFAKLLTGKPLMCTIHAYEIYQNPNPKLFPIALAACDQLLTISDYNRNRISKEFNYAKHAIEVVKCSIDLSDYRPAEKFRILIVGFFVQRKGHRYLFEAVKKLADRNIEVWVVGGDGAEDDAVDVRAIAQEYDLESQVAFFGKQSGTALRAMYHACDVFCLPCHFDNYGVGEGFPVVIIEAMACGKPVISTKHVAIPDILEQIVVDEKDADQLAEAISAVQGSAALREEMGIANRKLAEQHFDASNVEATARIVKRLMGQDESPTPLPSRVNEQHATSIGGGR